MKMEIIFFPKKQSLKKTTINQEMRLFFMQKHIPLLFLIFLCNFLSFSQAGIRLYPVQSNQTLKAAAQGYFYSDMQISNNYYADRRDAIDTLDLPFFDDFTSSQIYPDMRLWMDSMVYINSSFPISAPSYGVATFDNLDKTGKPYEDNININDFRAWDTLTSLPINLKTYNVGINEHNYSISDSIFLSFFYQGGGLGDRPESKDSLVVQFRLRNGKWYSVWNVSQIEEGRFRQVIIGISDSNYLWNAFQFRFLHYTSALGNLNQVHIDYVRMNRNRSSNDTLIRDVAINQKPWSLLKNYYSMPYSHFVVDSANQKASKHSIGVRNNDVDVINTQFQFEAYHKSNPLAIFPFSASSRNIFAESDTVESFNTFGFGNLPQNEYVHIKNVYKINPQAGNNTPAVYNSIGNNDEYIQFQDFKNYYSYDDGTAEGGIGLSYEGLPPGRGAFAIKYTLTKPDTFAGLAVFFNRSLEDVSARQFKLCIWKNLSEGSMDDDPIYEYPVLAPAYTDSINGFHYFVFDTTIVLPKGDFYVGWSQIAIFNLNVGYDNNYRLAGQEQRNNNILYNLLGVWQYPDAQIKGAPMIRPLIGKYSDWGLHTTKKIETVNSQYIVFPNPNNGLFEIKSPISNANLSNFSIKSIDGKEILNGSFFDRQIVDLTTQPQGIYILTLSDNHQVQVEKIIKR